MRYINRRFTYLLTYLQRMRYCNYHWRTDRLWRNLWYSAVLTLLMVIVYLKRFGQFKLRRPTLACTYGCNMMMVIMMVIMSTLFSLFDCCIGYYTSSPEKKSPQYSRHNRSKLGHNFVFVDVNNPDTSLQCKIIENLAQRYNIPTWRWRNIWRH